jgi:hypothetical protein
MSLKNKLNSTLRFGFYLTSYKSNAFPSYTRKHWNLLRAAEIAEINVTPLIDVQDPVTSKRTKTIHWSVYPNFVFEVEKPKIIRSCQ